MASPFDNQRSAEPLPIAERRHLDELAAQQRQTYLLVGLAIALPVLAAAVLVACLVLPLMRSPRGTATDSNGSQPAVPLDLRAQRELQRQQAEKRAEERAEEEQREIRQRVDRAHDAKQREAQRRERWLPPRLDESGDEGDRTLNP